LKISSKTEHCIWV